MAPDRRVTEDVDGLYALPLEEFTRARNELAARLKKDGDAERAAEVKALPKPSVSAWTVNQLARRRAKDVRSLLAAGERLRAAQSQGGEELRDALRAQRNAVAHLTDAARVLLRDERGGASETVVQRVATTLRAAAADERATELIEAGRLSEDVEPTGFEAIAALAPAPKKRAAAPKRDTAATRRRRVDEAKKRVRERKAKAAQLDARADELEREAERAARAARRAERDAADARATADRAANEVAESEAEVRALEDGGK